MRHRNKALADLLLTANPKQEASLRTAPCQGSATPCANEGHRAVLTPSPGQKLTKPIHSSSLCDVSSREELAYQARCYPARLPAALFQSHSRQTRPAEICWRQLSVVLQSSATSEVVE
eukprot:1043437-Amphidinium_carterae.1